MMKFGILQKTDGMILAEITGNMQLFTQRHTRTVPLCYYRYKIRDKMVKSYPFYVVVQLSDEVGKPLFVRLLICLWKVDKKVRPLLSHLICWKHIFRLQ